MKNFNKICLFVLCAIFTGVHAAEHQEGLDLFFKDVQGSFNLSGDVSVASLEKLLQLKINADQLSLDDAKKMTQGLQKLEEKINQRSQEGESFTKISCIQLADLVNIFIDDIPATILELTDKEKKCTKDLGLLMSKYAAIKNPQDTDVFSRNLFDHIQECLATHQDTANKVNKLGSQFKDRAAFVLHMKKNHKELYGKCVDCSMEYGYIILTLKKAYELKSFGGDDVY